MYIPTDILDLTHGSDTRLSYCVYYALLIAVAIGDYKYSYLKGAVKCVLPHES